MEEEQKQIDKNVAVPKRRYTSNIKIFIILFAVILCILSIANCPKSEVKIIEYEVLSEKTAYVKYNVTNKDSVEHMYRIDGSIKINGEVVVKKTVYVIVDAKETESAIIYFETERNISLYGSSVMVEIVSEVT